MSSASSGMKPRFAHDCAECVYVGTVRSDAQLVDWYRHDYGDHVSMVGRYSSEPSHNVTPYHDKPLTEYRNSVGTLTLSADALIAYALKILSSSVSGEKP